MKRGFFAFAGWGNKTYILADAVFRRISGGDACFGIPSGTGRFPDAIVAVRSLDCFFSLGFIGLDMVKGCYGIGKEEYG